MATAEQAQKANEVLREVVKAVIEMVEESPTMGTPESFIAIALEGVGISPETTIKLLNRMVAEGMVTRRYFSLFPAKKG